MQVFVRAVHEAKWLDDVQLSVYDSSFDPCVHKLPGLVPDAFIYLRAQPETCHQRLLRRAPRRKSTVSLDYLTNLHEKHEGWLYPHLQVCWLSLYCTVHPGCAFTSRCRLSFQVCVLALLPPDARALLCACIGCRAWGARGCW